MRYVFFQLLLVLASLQSCQKETSDFADIYWGEASALKNGAHWQGSVYARPHEPYGFYVRMDAFDARGFHREALTIFKIPLSVQHNEIDTVREEANTALTGATYSTLVDDGDVLGDLFRVYGGGDNHVTVSSFNAATGEVAGEFAVTLVFAGPPDTRSDSTASDTICFKEGRFHTKIRQEP